MIKAYKFSKEINHSKLAVQLKKAMIKDDKHQFHLNQCRTEILIFTDRLELCGNTSWVIHSWKWKKKDGGRAQEVYYLQSCSWLAPTTGRLRIALFHHSHNIIPSPDSQCQRKGTGSAGRLISGELVGLDREKREKPLLQNM